MNIKIFLILMKISLIFAKIDLEFYSLYRRCESEFILCGNAKVKKESLNEENIDISSSYISNVNNITNTIYNYKDYEKINILIKNLKKAIDEKPIISFDIYDTLVIRPYFKPTDLFVHLEKLYNATGFANARITAKGFTFDEIYKNIDKKYRWLKEKELSLEYNVTSPRPLLKNIYEYAVHKNKKIIIISDMYFSKKYLSKILKKCGYTKFMNLYVSSAYHKTKKSGSLYSKVIKKLNINSNKILHIGDNYKSDILQARKLGLNAFYVPTVMRNFLESDYRIKIFQKHHKKELGASIMLGLLAPHFECSFNNYWYEFGYKYAGPVILGFMEWLDDQLKKDKIYKVLFVARDGYTLEKVFNIIKTSNASSYYFYFNRKIVNDIFSKNKTISENMKKEFMLYLKKVDIKNDNKLAIVDSVTKKWTSQRGINFFFPEKFIKGYYWFTGYRKKYKNYYKNMKHESYQKDHKKHRFGDLIELIMTAPTSPIIGIKNGNPIFKVTNESEKIIINLYPKISNGAIDFAKNFLELFNKLNIYFSCDMLIDWINYFKDFHTEVDKTMFSNIKGSFTGEHENYQLIFNIGVPFSGKKTQCEKISNEFKYSKLYMKEMIQKE